MKRGHLFIFKSISTTDRQMEGLVQRRRLCLGGCKLRVVCVCLCVPGNTQPSLWEHIQHYRGAYQSRCFISTKNLTLDIQKGSVESQWGYSHRGENFKIDILLILYGPDCFYLAAPRYRCMMCHFNSPNQCALLLDKNKVDVWVLWMRVTLLRAHHICFNLV